MRTALKESVGPLFAGLVQMYSPAGMHTLPGIVGSHLMLKTFVAKRNRCMPLANLAQFASQMQ